MPRPIKLRWADPKRGTGVRFTSFTNSVTTAPARFPAAVATLDQYLNAHQQPPATAARSTLLCPSPHLPLHLHAPPFHRFPWHQLLQQRRLRPQPNVSSPFSVSVCMIDEFHNALISGHASVILSGSISERTSSTGEAYLDGEVDVLGHVGEDASGVMNVCAIKARMVELRRRRCGCRRVHWRREMIGGGGSPYS